MRDNRVDNLGIEPVETNLIRQPSCIIGAILHITISYPIMLLRNDFVSYTY